MTVTFVRIAAFCLVLGASGLAAAQDAGDRNEEISARADGGMVAADHPRASEVGADVLKSGGNAADAAIATLLTLGVVNPFGSGLGGGGFCLVRPADGDVDVIDFRERAPGKAHRDMYIRDGEADVDLTIYGGLAVGVPGEARGLEALHQKYGEASWTDVVAPAHDLAASGFRVRAELVKRLERGGEKLEEASKEHARAFKQNGRWVEAGMSLKRPKLARALALLQKEGASPFYEGEIAAAIVRANKAAGGILEKRDLAGYQVTWRDPLRGEYRGYEIFAMPPPSSGGITIIETLNILGRYDLATLGYTPESVHRITEALKHAFADRATWLGDADFVDVPTARLTSEEYARSLKVRPDGTLTLKQYGTSAQLPTDGGTSHVSVIDGAGNMVACTSTINTSFGSLVYVPEYGLVLNNEMADFTAQPGVPNVYGLMGTEQNAVEPGKRPLSSMSPTLIMKDGEPFMAVGASGGPTIITGTLLAMIRTIDWGWPADRAIAAPRIHHQWVPEKLMVEGMPAPWLGVLRERGHDVEMWDAYNSVQMVVRKPDGTLVGVSDPRKHGSPAGVPANEK